MRVLVLGATGGLGAAVVRACVERGYWPIVAYCQREQRAQQIVAACGAGETVRLDLRDACPLGNSACSDIETVINCAGANSFQRSLLHSTADELQQMLAVNTLGPLQLLQWLDRHASLPAHVIMVLSTAIHCRGTGPYALAKAAGLAACKLLHYELLGRVRVDAVVPGWMETEMAQAAASASGRSLAAVRAEHPEGRLLEPTQVAQLCVSLMDAAENEMQGQVVVWDRRLALEPVYCEFESVLAFDRLAVGSRASPPG